MTLQLVRQISFVVVVLTGIFPVIAHADIDSNPMVVYSKSGDAKPYYAQWSGSAWTPSSGAAMPSIGATADWVVLQNCPTRYETACATLDSSRDVNVLFHNGTTWSNPTEVCADVGSGAQRSVSMAYENSSGDLMIAYWDGSVNKVGYRIYNGSTLSSQSTLSLANNSTPNYLALYAKPGGEEIILVVIQNGPLSAAVWNGNAWGAVEKLCTNIPYQNQECASLAYESASGRAVLVYTDNAPAWPYYRIWDGSSWSDPGSVVGMNVWNQWLRLVADPDSNSILLAGLYESPQVRKAYACNWNGSSWGTPALLETDFPDADSRRIDVAYEKGTGKGLVVYQESSDSSLRYRTWSGSSWSTEQTGPNIGNASRFIQLRSGNTTGEVFVAASDGGDDLELLRWNGAALSTAHQVCGSLGGSATTEPFMMTTAASRKTLPANTPYATDFESGMGSEWNCPESTGHATLTTFAGRHRGGDLKLALYTTVGETYRLAFDFYAIDSWNGNAGTSGPDAFHVAVNSTNVFNHTFTHETPASGASYPYVYDQSDHYGFDSGAKDGIYRKVEVVFTAESTVSTISFLGSLTDESGGGFDDESWGIDDVSVQSARFLDVSSTTGFSVQASTSADSYGGGAAWADLDGDGDLDALVSGNSARAMINGGAGQSFSSIALGDLRRHFGLVDIDNDGDIDFWTGCAAGPDAERCYLNNGAGGFSSGGNLGFSSPSNNEAACAADINKDGWCDVVMFSENSNWIGRHTGSLSPALTESNSANDGLNAAGDFGDGDYCSAGDVNNDGLLDVFYHYSGGKLFVSNSAGTYDRNNYGISVSTGAAKKIGSAWADYDNDGDLDLFCPRYDETCSGYLWRNDRDWTANTGNFTNVTSAAGFNFNTSVDYTPDKPGARSCAWGDYDNDGDVDLFIAGPNGNNYLYQNQGNGAFVRVADGTTMAGAFIDGTFVDYDNDGDLDLCATRENGTLVLLQNRTNNGNYLKVRVVGSGGGKTNKAAIGTRVELWNATGTTRLARRDIGVARGFGGTEPLWAHFGGVTPTSTYQVKVHFESGVSTKTVVPAGTSSTIGSTVIPKMLTVAETGASKVIKWIEVPNRAL